MKGSGPFAAEILGFILGREASPGAGRTAPLAQLGKAFDFQPKTRQGSLQILPIEPKGYRFGIFGMSVTWKARLHGFRHCRGDHLLTVVDRTTGEALVSSIPIYADPQGRFLMRKEYMTTIATITDLEERVFIPYGVLSGGPDGRDPWLCLFTLLDDQPEFVLSTGGPLDLPELFADRWALLAPRPPASPDELDLFEEGVVALTSAVIRVDGVIKPEEIQVVREFHARLFQGQPAKMGQARQILKRFLAEPPDLEPVLAKLADRPAQEKQVIIALLLSIASSDGELKASELTLIDGIRRRFGIGDAEFEKMAADFQPEDFPWYKVLGLAPGASWEAIAEAWQKKSREYHPDLYPTLPDSFREFAQREYQRVQEAYRALAGKFGQPV